MISTDLCQISKEEEMQNRLEEAFQSSTTEFRESILKLSDTDQGHIYIPHYFPRYLVGLHFLA